MKEAWKRFRIWAIAVSACMLLLGVLMLIWPEVSALAICCMLGVVCIGSGIYDLVRYFKLGTVGLFFRFDLTMGFLNILLGVLMLCHPYGAAALLPIAVGLYLIVDSIFDIQLAVEIQRYSLGSWVPSLVLGVITLFFSILLLIDPFTGATALMLFIGLSLIVSSIRNLYRIYNISKAIKKWKDGSVVDAESYTVSR